MELRKSQRIAVGVLVLAFLFIVLGRGISESFSVFLLPITASQGWDRGAVVTIYALSALCTGLASPIVGRVFDKTGPRLVYTIGMALTGGALLIAGLSSELWQLQLSIGIAAGIGIAFMGPVPNTIMLSRWYGKRLPTAMAIYSSAMGAGVLIMLPLAQVLIDGHGWRYAYDKIGWALLLLLIPLSLLPWGMLARGNPHVETTAPSHSANDGLTLAQAAKGSAFWGLGATYFFTAIGMFAITPQVVAYLVDVGFPALQAATAWGLSGVVLVFGMLTISWLDGVIGRRPSLMVSYGTSLAGLVMLWGLQHWPNYILLTGFVLAFGSMVGSRGPLIAATALRIFRGKRVGTIFGTITIGSGLGAAIGSWCGGLIHDRTDSYNWLIAFAFVATATGMIPFLVVRQLRD